MNKDIYDEVIDAIVLETISSLPEDVVNYYLNLPGRHPSDYHRRIASALGSFDKDTATDLIRDVVDRSIFSVLYLITNRFKDKDIITNFSYPSVDKMPPEVDLIYRYRSKVDPGGIQVDTNYGDNA